MFIKASCKTGGLACSYLVKKRFNFAREVAKFDPSKDYYQILQIGKEANDRQIKQSYYKLAKMYHPDHSQGRELKFKQVTQAYFVLSHPHIKKQYIQARLSKRPKVSKVPASNVYKRYKDMSAQERTKWIQDYKNKIWRNFIFFIILLIISQIPLDQTGQQQIKSNIITEEAKTELILAETNYQSSSEYLPQQDTNSFLIAQHVQDNQSFLLPDYSNSDFK